MKADGGVKDYSPAVWGIRIALCAFVGVVGYYATSRSLADALSNDQVELAHQIAPNNARITAELARFRMLADPRFANRADEESLARSAMRTDAAAVPAVTTLGLISQVRGDDATAQRLFAYANQLSRRDVLTQTWLIEHAVSRGNIVEALHQYDIALRTNSAARDIFFPVLAAASNEPAIAAALVNTLAAQPEWGVPFLWFVGTNSGNPQATARLFANLYRRDIPVSEAAQAALIDALIKVGAFDEAWGYYALLHRSADRTHLRDPDFSDMVDVPSYLDWIPAAGDTGLSAIIQASAHGGVLDFSAPASVGGEIVKQLQLLPPGNYVIAGHSFNVEQLPNTLPYWVLRCFKDGRELGRVGMANSTVNNGLFMGRFTVPLDCKAQYLALVIHPSETLSGVNGQIDHVQLRLIK